MERKLLFLVFTNDPCKRNHAFMYAIDLHNKGYQVRMVIEGEATGCFGSLDDSTSSFPQLFAEAKQAGLIAGACKTASGGCSTNDPCRKVTDIIAQQQIPLLHDMREHAGIEPYVRDGYEILIF